MTILLPFESSGTEIPKPDFAFPVTVIEQSEELMRTASAMAPEQAAVTRLRATLQICRAKTDIDPESIYDLPGFIASQAEEMSNFPAGQAMALLLEARILHDIYQNDSYRINQVSAPLLPLPEDIRLWSAEQFSAQRDSLVNQAISISRTHDAPLSVFNSCLEIDPVVERYLETVYNFICLDGLKIKETAIVQSDRLSQLLELSPGKPQEYLWYYLCGESYNVLSEIYEQNQNDPMAQIVLLAVARTWSQSEEGVEIASEDEETDNLSWQRMAYRILELENKINLNLERFPDDPLTESLRNALEDLHKPVAFSHTRGIVTPYAEITLKGQYLFCPRLEVRLYRLPDSSTDRFVRKEQLSTMPCVYTQSIETQSESVESFSFTLPPQEAGRYAIVLSADDTNVSSPNLITVSPIYPVSVSGTDSDAVVTVDPFTGKPVSGITVHISERGTGTQVTEGVSDSKGLFTFPMRADSRTVSFSQNGKPLPSSLNLNVYGQDEEDDTTQTDLLIITDRELYHPGETVRWSVIAGRRRNGDRSVVSGQELTLSFYNVNHEVIDTVSVRTDEMGRAFGSFDIPRDGLIGTFYIRSTGNPDFRAYQDITVSDFRLPVFELKDCTVERDIPVRGDVTVTGHAVSFSGMNIIGANVRVTVNEAYRTRRFQPGRRLGQVDSITDGAGDFSVVIPATLLSSESGCYSARITVTTAAGETADEELPFTTGRPYILQLVSASTYDASALLPLKVMAYNSGGDNVPLEFSWQLTDKNRQECLRGTGMSGTTLDIDASALSAGTYYFNATAVDTTLADALTATEIVLYNRARNLVPDLKNPLFLPEESVKIDRHGRGELLLGIAEDQAWVYIAYPGNLMNRPPEVKRLKRGFHTIRVTGVSEDSRLTIFTVKDGSGYSAAVNLEVPSPASPALTASSFRDKLLPGAQERWTFTLIKADGSAIVPAAMVARMYNRALDLISPADFPHGFSFYTRMKSLNVGWSWTLRDNISLYLNDLSINIPQLPQPILRFLPQYMVEMVKYTGAMLRANALSMDMASTEELEYDGMLAEDVATAGSEDGSMPAEENTIKYRPSEVLQAFFRPEIRTDQQGNMVIEFTVPEANGSWSFQALAWDTSTASANFAAEIVSSKPVMIQPNMPRFLRQGDKARLLATVFNNTDTQASVTARIEIFDFESEQILNSSESVLSIPSGMSAICALDLEVPTSTSALGYRVYAVTEDFSDGERGAIPVLEAVQTVIDSHEFYLNPSSSEPVNISVPVEPEMSYTLEFCNNPIWVAVKALRGVAAEVPSTSSALSSQLFSLLAGAYLADHNPRLAEVVHTWKENPESQALVSMLQRNEELKQFLLGSTPWIQTAKDNNLRMASLSQLFDSEANEEAVNKRVENLLALQNPDGGLRWANCWETSSVWATENFLITMGLAKSLDIPLPEDMEPIIEQGFSYLCSRFDNSRPTETDPLFTLISALMPDMETTESARRVISNTVNEIERTWRNHSITNKAFDVLILTALGHNNQAEPIFRSIEQFAVTSPDMGLSFPSVEDIRSYATIMQAYKAMNAPAERLDAMRQWVILRSQVSDDLGAFNPDYVIAALLLSGTEWTSDTPEAHITVNGQALTVSHIEAATGYFTAPVSPSAAGIELTVTPNGLTPSYGALIGIGQRSMAAVEARPGRDISIDKRILVMRENQWVETDSLILGERARVQLTLRAERDLQYVTVTDLRAATFAPVEQLPRYMFQAGLFFYRENRNTSTNVFIYELPAGVYRIEYDMTASVSGTFSSGTATVQSQYAPEITARSGAAIINVNNRQ